MMLYSLNGRDKLAKDIALDMRYLWKQVGR